MPAVLWLNESGRQPIPLIALDFKAHATGFAAYRISGLRIDPFPYSQQLVISNFSAKFLHGRALNEKDNSKFHIGADSGRM